MKYTLCPPNNPKPRHRALGAFSVMVPANPDDPKCQTYIRYRHRQPTLAKAVDLARKASVANGKAMIQDMSKPVGLFINGIAKYDPRLLTF